MKINPPFWSLDEIIIGNNGFGIKRRFRRLLPDKKNEHKLAEFKYQSMPYYSFRFKSDFILMQGSSKFANDKKNFILVEFSGIKALA